MALDANEVIQCRGVFKSFGGVQANQNISLNVFEGHITGLIGPNGSGKTTLFNSIVGYHPIDSGSILFRSKEISRLRVPNIARLGLLRTFQQTRIYSNMNCVDNMLISVPHRNEMFMNMFTKYPPEEREKAEANLLVYFKSPTGVGEHPDLVGEMAKLIDEISHCRGSLDALAALTKPTDDDQSADQ